MTFRSRDFGQLAILLSLTASLMLQSICQAEESTESSEVGTETATAITSDCPSCQQGYMGTPYIKGRWKGHRHMKHGYHYGYPTNQANCPSCQQHPHVYSQCPQCRLGHGRHQYYNGAYGPQYGQHQHVSPGYGWCAPTKVPVQRERVEYGKYYPTYWSGQGPGTPVPHHPMVHTPTDTTQLGFTYQSVPSWSPQPWRIPGVPHPAVWHQRYCGRCSHHPSYYVPSKRHGQYGYGYCPPMATTPQESKSESSTEESTTEAPLPPQEARIEMPTPATPAMPRLSIVPDAPPEA